MNSKTRFLLPLVLALVALSTSLLPHRGYATPLNEVCEDLLQTGGASSSKKSKLVRTDGVFKAANKAKHDVLAEIYRRAGITKPIAGEIRRVGESDLTLNLEKLTSAELETLMAEGRKAISKLYCFTSGAGLWSRGGGQVKALIPFNIKKLLSEADFALLSESGDIANAAKAEDVLKLAKRSLVPGEQIETVADAIVRERRAILSRLIAQARLSPDSMTPVDMKLANVAIQSELGETYIPFDIWTSEQTHAAIRQYLLEFEKSYTRKNFHADPVIDRNIKRALGKYIEQSHERGETHLFGYQLGYHAFDLNSVSPIVETPAIGEGAGMAKAYLDKMGRTDDLIDQGKTTWVFENIEVLTDLPLAMGAHERGGKPVSVILVPERPGYKGGSPFLVNRGHSWNLELHEMSVLPPEFATGNAYFNSNTIFQSLSLAPPKNVGFEVKNNGTGKIVRVKMNAGDITLEAPTAGIGGRIGVEYENFKNYAEFGQNGEQLIRTYQGIWARDAAGL